MRLITLNLWGGKRYDDIVEFLQREKEDTDIFCFQEVFDSDREEGKGFVPNLYNRLKSILDDFNSYYVATEHGVDFDDVVDYELSVGNAIFVKNDVLTHDNVQIYDGGNNIQDWSRKAHAIELEDSIICNVHGAWLNNKKRAHPKRREQSKRINTFLDQWNKPAVVCGDFNMLPDIPSMDILEEGRVNWIKEKNITDTRTSYFHYGIRYADYVLTSPSLDVKSFEVMPDEVSDHAPLLLVV
jgi:endonuclease/exonuclease/phosphatase family metal-dependent hydrolase